jgi:glycosyltransferase involved in cell wall biosynthesis
VNGVIFSKGSYPIGSWHQRIRMMKKGFEQNGISFINIVPYPAPTIEAKTNSEDFVFFMLKPVKSKRKRNLFAIFFKTIGTLKGIYFLSKQKNIEFIILPGLDFFEGILIYLICWLKKIKFFAEIADENGKLYAAEKLSIVDTLAKYNQIFYEKLILKKAKKIFVFTSYLENKYNKMFPNYGNVIRCIPSMIDLDSFYSQRVNNIEEIDQPNISVLKNDNAIKFTYAGACNRTNGIFFFLKNLSSVLKDIDIDVKLFFFFVYGNVDIVKDYCKKLGIIDRVFFFEAVYPKYIPAIYENSDILVLPEHGDVIANAGFPGKTSELLASGKAIIATRFSDLGDYLINEQNSMISDLGDSQKYMYNLKKIIMDEELRKRIGINAQKTAKNVFGVKDAVNIYICEKNSK